MNRSRTGMERSPAALLAPASAHWPPGYSLSSVVLASSRLRFSRTLRLSAGDSSIMGDRRWRL